MSKYFINNEIYFQNKKMPPQKIIITYMEENEDGHTAYCIGNDENSYTLELNEIFDDNDNPIKDARNKLKMTQKEFAEFLDIPKRTIEDWERKVSKPTNYLLAMIMEKVFSIIYVEGDDKK